MRKSEAHFQNERGCHYDCAWEKGELKWEPLHSHPGLRDLSSVCVIPGKLHDGLRIQGVAMRPN